MDIVILIHARCAIVYRYINMQKIAENIYACIYLFASLASPFIRPPPFSAIGTFLGSTATASKPVCSSELLASSSGALPDECQDYGSHYGSNPVRDERLSGHRPPELPEPSMGSRPKPTRILPSPSGLQAGYCK